MAPALIVTIVRHAETEENRLRIVQGQLDTKLSDAGRKQADVVAAALAAPEDPFSHAFSSDLSRCVEVRLSSNWSGPWSDRSDPKTAEAILRYHPHLRLEKQELLRERVTNTRRVSPCQRSTHPPLYSHAGLPKENHGRARYPIWNHSTP